MARGFGLVTEELEIFSDSLAYLVARLVNIPRTQDLRRIGCLSALGIECQVPLALEPEPVSTVEHRINKVFTMEGAQRVTTGAQHTVQLIQPCTLPRQGNVSENG